MKSLFAAFITTLLLLSSVAAQDTKQSLAPETRIGVDNTKRVPMTMREAVTLALENNRDIAIERENVRLNEWDVKASMGVYDPTISGTFGYQRVQTPVTSIFGAGTTTALTGTANFNQRLQNRYGSIVQGTLNNNRATTDNPFNDLNPQITTSLNLSFIQPLFRNKNIDLGRRTIRLAKKRLDISDSQFRQRAIEIISQVQRAYWDLVFARRDYEIKRGSLEVGLTQLEHNQRLVEAGTLAPSDVISTRVDIERRKDELEAAMEVIQRAENGLKALMLQPASADLWEAVIEPTDRPEINTDVAMSLKDAVGNAFKNRPELEQFRLRGELNEIDVEYYKDQTKPQIDFYATYGTLGLAGSLRSTANPLAASNAALYGRINQLSALAGLPPISAGGGFGLTNPKYVGSYPKSVWNLLKNTDNTISFGVQFNLPLRNTTAKAQLGRALQESKQIDVQKQRAMQGIEVEVRNTLQAVETAKRRVEAARNSRVNAELQLASEQRKFDAGQSTNFFVLDRQNALASAQGRELRALTDYNKAVAELQRAISTTLTINNISFANTELQK
ncbi:MAG TPA: TolC family protein [Blastocatellia bacterium]|nr:TolC family protein [Blastocatellia bacterium]